MFHKKTIRDVDVRGKIVLLRVDFNVPLKNGEIEDDTRMQETLPTIRFLQEKGAKIVLISHFGRPKGKDENFSLKPIAKHLEILLNENHISVLDIDDTNTESMLKKMNSGNIVMLENIRFYEGETKDPFIFGKRLAQLGDIFVNDAFGSCHRIHGSIVGIAQYKNAYAGLLLEKEIRHASELLENVAHPFIAIIGGKKASSKIPVIDRLLEKVDTLLIGGGVANTFFKAWGLSIGASFDEQEMDHIAHTLIWKAMRSNTSLKLPVDVKVTENVENSQEIKNVLIEEIQENEMIADIGNKTIEDFQKTIQNAKTILWSGPMGIFEQEEFRTGNNAIIDAIASSGAYSVVGGGDTIASLAGNKNARKISFLSTGGSALLEFIEKGTLPGIESLQNA